MPVGGTKTSISGLFGNAPFEATFAPSSALFSPGLPPAPAAPQPTRVIDFPAGTNLQWTPRGYEPFSFASLRAFSNVELVRLAIETRKDQIERLDWTIKPRSGRDARSDASSRIRRVERFFDKPDGDRPFGSWFRPVVEDLLSIDAPTIERRRNRSGDLIGLDYVDGSTVKVLVDRNGRTPALPAPAYEQIIKGHVWNQLTTEDLIYAPRNLRGSHMYGFSPVEQIVVTVNTIINRQTAQLSYFTEGNVPRGLVNAPEGWTSDQLRTYQEWFDSRLSGNVAERMKVLWAPAGAKYQAFKDSPIKDEFDEWLARIVSYAFSLPPTPFIRQMNRATAQEDQDRALEEGLEPLLVWSKRLFDRIIAEDLGFPDLEFSWEVARDLDPKKQAEVHEIRLRSGVISINEARAEIGLPPVTGGDKPMIYTSRGAMPLEAVIKGALAEVEPEKPEPDGGKPSSSKDDEQ